VTGAGVSSWAFENASPKPKVALLPFLAFTLARVDAVMGQDKGQAALFLLNKSNQFILNIEL